MLKGFDKETQPAYRVRRKGTFARHISRVEDENRKGQRGNKPDDCNAAYHSRVQDRRSPMQEDNKPHTDYRRFTRIDSHLRRLLFGNDRK